MISPPPRKPDCNAVQDPVCSAVLHFSSSRVRRDADCLITSPWHFNRYDGGGKDATAGALSDARNGGGGRENRRCTFGTIKDEKLGLDGKQAYITVRVLVCCLHARRMCTSMRCRGVAGSETDCGSLDNKFFCKQFFQFTLLKNMLFEVLRV